MFKKLFFISLSSVLLSTTALCSSDEEINYQQPKNSASTSTTETAKFDFATVKEAAEAGDMKATLLYAVRLQYGIDCEPSEENKKLALGILKNAAETGDKEAKFAYANALEKGIGCEPSEKNRMLAIKFYKEAAEAGDARAKCIFAYTLENSIGCESSDGNKKLALKLYKEAAEDGDFEAKNNYGCALQYGRGCEPSEENKKLGLEILKEAANSGYRIAKINYAHALQEGIGCEPSNENKKLGMGILKNLAEAGDKDASFQYAHTLQIGNGCPANEKLALHYYELAYEAGVKEAIIGICRMYAINASLMSTGQAYEYALQMLKDFNYPNLVSVVKDMAFSSLIEVKYKQGLNIPRNTYNMFFLAQKGGADVSKSFISFLERRTQEVTGKKKYPVTADKAALKSYMIHLKDVAKSEHTELLSKIDRFLDSNTAFKLDLDKIKVILKNSLDIFKKKDDKNAATMDDIQSFITIIKNVKNKIILEEKRIEHERRSQVNSHSLNKENAYPFCYGETKENKNLKSEVKEEAEKKIAKHDLRKLKKGQKKKTKNKKKKEVDNNSAEKEKPFAQSFNGVFKDVKFLIEGDLVLQDSDMKDIHNILNLLKSAKDYSAAVQLLKNMQGGLDFKQLKSSINSFPIDCIVYQMRLNKKYRVLIPFFNRDGLNNSNNGPEKKIFTIYNNTIHIMDNHKK